VAYRFAHPADLTISPFSDRQQQYRILVTTSWRHQDDSCRKRAMTVERNAFA
jgi:hypothetical protein